MEETQLKIYLPVGLVGRNGYTDEQIITRREVRERTGVDLGLQVVFYGSGYSKAIVDQASKDLESFSGLTAHEKPQLTAFDEKDLNEILGHLGYFQGLPISSFSFHVPRLYHYGTEGILAHRQLANTGYPDYQACPFDREEYYGLRERCVDVCRKIREEAERLGMGNIIAIENVPAHDYNWVPEELRNGFDRRYFEDER